MLSLLGYSVWIEMEGKEIPQFGAVVDEMSRTATCWIPSEAGKEFAVVIKYERRESDSRARLVFDGSDMLTKSLRRTDVSNVTLKNSVLEEDGNFVQRKFRFSEVKLTDNDAYLDRYVSNDMGTLSITMNRVRLGLKTELDQNPGSSVGAISQTIVHEKSKKVPTHCVTLGQPKRCKNYCRSLKVYDRSDPQPFATFIFKYRPADFLQARELMPRPLPNRKRKNSEQLDEEMGIESKEGSSVQTHNHSQNSRVKPESSRKGFAQKGARSPKKAKTEPSAAFFDSDIIDLTQTRDTRPSVRNEKRKRSSPFTQGEVIDLT